MDSVSLDKSNKYQETQRLMTGLFGMAAKLANALRAEFSKKMNPNTISPKANKINNIEKLAQAMDFSSALNAFNAQFNAFYSLHDSWGSFIKLQKYLPNLAKKTQNEIISKINGLHNTLSGTEKISDKTYFDTIHYYLDNYKGGYLKHFSDSLEAEAKNMDFVYNKSIYYGSAQKFMTSLFEAAAELSNILGAEVAQKQTKPEGKSVQSFNESDWRTWYNKTSWVEDKNFYSVGSAILNKKNKFSYEEAVNKAREAAVRFIGNDALHLFEQVNATTNQESPNKIYVLGKVPLTK